MSCENEVFNVDIEIEIQNIELSLIKKFRGKKHHVFSVTLSPR